MGRPASTLTPEPSGETDEAKEGELRPHDGFIPIDGLVAPRLSRALGYFGQQRLVMFYFDALADGVVWRDGVSYGFGTGAWQAYADHVEPLAAARGIRLGAGPDAHVLLLDRRRERAYFAPRRVAQEVVGRQRAHREDAPAKTEETSWWRAGL